MRPSRLLVFWWGHLLIIPPWWGLYYVIQPYANVSIWNLFILFSHFFRCYLFFACGHYFFGKFSLYKILISIYKILSSMYKILIIIYKILIIIYKILIIIYKILIIIYKILIIIYKILITGRCCLITNAVIIVYSVLAHNLLVISIVIGYSVAVGQICCENLLCKLFSKRILGKLFLTFV